MNYFPFFGEVAKWQGRGLQILYRGFDSRPRLHLTTDALSVRQLADIQRVTILKWHTKVRHKPIKIPCQNSATLSGATVGIL